MCVYTTKPSPKPGDCIFPSAPKVPSFLPLPHPPLQATTDLLSVIIGLRFLEFLYMEPWVCTLWVWLLSLSLVLNSPCCSVSRGQHCYPSVVPTIGQCHICVSIPVDGHSSWLKSLVIVSHAAVNIHAQVSFYTSFDVSWVVKWK